MLSYVKLSILSPFAVQERFYVSWDSKHFPYLPQTTLTLKKNAKNILCSDVKGKTHQFLEMCECMLKIL